MIDIKVRMRNGEMEIYAVGHANFAPLGQDIVCAAVSTIMQTAVLGLEAIAEDYPENVRIDTQDIK